MNICAGHAVGVLEEIFPLRLQLIAAWLERGGDDDLVVTGSTALVEPHWNATQDSRKHPTEYAR